jgi:uncharacterized protein YyaL (SSP411 family)
MRPTTHSSSTTPKCFAFILAFALLHAIAIASAADPAKPNNRLAKETSPYLLGHAHNPVDWFPWGPEALEKANREGKVIFLSIGYSSCHWCHVMERESFEDAEIAKYLNDHFVCIKVDREERPDIDAIYMAALHVYNQLAGTGRGGGWPLSMFLTPAAEPFVGGTYFPARDGDREGVSGFFQLAQKVQDFWSKSPDRIRGDAQIVAKHTKEELEKRRPALKVPLDDSLPAATLAGLADEFDPKYAGFGYTPDGRRPKFPEPSNLFFLLDRAHRTADKQAADKQATEMLLATLEKMALGGIHDHLGGAFHRYSTDRYWRIPHFEKMLYDNAQLASVYALAADVGWDKQAQPAPAHHRLFHHVTTNLCNFILRELTDSTTGGFCTALDADSEGEEGRFYRWDKTEIQNALSAEEFSLLSAIYGLDRAPNFEEHFYVLQISKPLTELAAELQLTVEQLELKLAPIHHKLLTIRDKRPRPLTDTKILTAENGLMIAGLADAGRVFKEPRYTAAAAKATDFLLTKMRTPDGRLYRSYAAGEPRLNAYLNDYAFLTHGLIRLYEATQNPRWLDEADTLTARQLELFADNTGGGFYFTSSDHEALLARAKDLTDGALPSGNSVSALNLIYLATAKNHPDYLSLAEKTIATTIPILPTNPTAAPLHVTAIPALADAKSKPQVQK